MKTQLYTLQNWCVWGGTFVAGPVAQAVSSSYLLRSGEPDFLPSLYKRIYTTTIRLYKSCFPCWKSTTACKAQRLWRKDCCLPGSYENLPHRYSGCENHLLRRKWSFAFLICTEKPWAPLFNALGRHVDYFQSSSTLMSWKPNKPTETHQGPWKGGECHSFPAKLSIFEAWEAHGRNHWSTFTRQGLESRVLKGSPSNPRLAYNFICLIMTA